MRNNPLIKIKFFNTIKLILDKWADGYKVLNPTGIDNLMSHLKTLVGHVED